MKKAKGEGVKFGDFQHHYRHSVVRLIISVITHFLNHNTVLVINGLRMSVLLITNGKIIRIVPS